MKDHLLDIVQLSLGSSPEDMLHEVLATCIELSGASGGSILGEEGPFLQFLFSDVPELIGRSVPHHSIAGMTMNEGRIVYTYAPTDKRHYKGVETLAGKATRFLLSIPIPSIHRTSDATRKRKHAGALQLLFEHNVCPSVKADSYPVEFEVETFRTLRWVGLPLDDLFRILPLVAFALEVMRLRQTSYQVIHELKNKLISGQSWLNCLKDDLRQQSAALAEDATISGDFEICESSLREGSELAKTYLQLTKLYEPKFAPADLNAVLRETAASVTALAQDMKLDRFRVELDLAPGLEPRDLDAGQLKMAFFNLCKNAVEALAQHGVTQPVIRIESGLVANRLTVCIADNGPGMPRDIANYLFVPFKTKKEGGTGLGLTITKKIVDVHGGSIRCETGPDGTRFRIEL